MAEFDSVIVKEWRKIEEDIEKTYIRPMNVENLKCVLTCFDRAGTAWSSRELEECKAPCFQKSQVKQMILDREIGEARNRFQMALTECQYKVRDIASNSQSQELSSKQRDALYSCETKSMQELAKSIKPMKDRIHQNMQQVDKAK